MIHIVPRKGTQALNANLHDNDWFVFSLIKRDFKEQSAGEEIRGYLGEDVKKKREDGEVDLNASPAEALL